MGELPAEREQRVTPLELFFDLVFVFAFTQVTTVLSDNPTWSGLAQLGEEVSGLNTEVIVAAVLGFAVRLRSGWRTSTSSRSAPTGCWPTEAALNGPR